MDCKTFQRYFNHPDSLPELSEEDVDLRSDEIDFLEEWKGHGAGCRACSRLIAHFPESHGAKLFAALLSIDARIESILPCIMSRSAIMGMVADEDMAAVFEHVSNCTLCQTEVRKVEVILGNAPGPSETWADRMRRISKSLLTVECLEEIDRNLIPVLHIGEIPDA